MTPCVISRLKEVLQRKHRTAYENLCMIGFILKTVERDEK